MSADLENQGYLERGMTGVASTSSRKLFSNVLVLRKVMDEQDKRPVFPQKVGDSNYELLQYRCLVENEHASIESIG